MNDRKVKVAVIGGGCASMAAVWELSRREHRGRYQVTVFQEGWRLGGKGASGRGANGRIEEHGLHVWLGFYDNAFRMMRECYDELAKDGDARFGDWRDAWIPEDDVTLYSAAEHGGFERWDAHMPPRRGMPGDPLPPGEVFSLTYYMARSFELFRALVLDTRVDDKGLIPVPTAGETGNFASQIAYVGRLAAFMTAATMAEALGVLATLLRTVADASLGRQMLPAAEAVCRGLRQWLEDGWLANDKRRYLWEVADLALATIVGLIRSGVMFDARGLDAIEDKGCREWLAENGASDRALQSPFLRGLFDLSMGYLAGDPEQPCLSAGQGLRGTLRTFFGYRGAFMWRMRAGMGDVVFAPLYTALKRRGVRFEFFHRLTNVELAGEPDAEGRDYVRRLTFDVQARMRGRSPYRPLQTVKERPCWPAKPLFQQLADGQRLEGEGRDFESHWNPPTGDEKTLEVARDFDLVVLGVGLGAVPYVCREIVQRDARWLRMTQEVKTVASQAFQLWLTEDLESLGWKGPGYITGAFAKPFDTWCDMSHVVPEEGWDKTFRPKTSVYFCAVLPDLDPASQDDPGYPGRRAREVRKAAESFLQGPMKHAWPKAYDENHEFRWELLAVGEDSDETGPARLDTQYCRANVNPTDRYVIHTPGSFRYRISPLDMSYDNLTVAGDWTDSGFHSGCVEGAVMSGLLAAHALSGTPKLEDIVAYDHP